MKKKFKSFKSAIATTTSQENDKPKYEFVMINNVVKSNHGFFSQSPRR